MHNKEKVTKLIHEYVKLMISTVSLSNRLKDDESTPVVGNAVSAIFKNESPDEDPVDSDLLRVLVKKIENFSAFKLENYKSLKVQLEKTINQIKRDFGSNPEIQNSLNELAEHYSKRLELLYNIGILGHAIKELKKEIGSEDHRELDELLNIVPASKTPDSNEIKSFISTLKIAAKALDDKYGTGRLDLAA